MSNRYSVLLRAVPQVLLTRNLSSLMFPGRNAQIYQLLVVAHQATIPSIRSSRTRSPTIPQDYIPMSLPLEPQYAAPLSPNSSSPEPPSNPKLPPSATTLHATFTLPPSTIPGTLPASHPPIQPLNPARNALASCRGIRTNALRPCVWRISIGTAEPVVPR